MIYEDQNDNELLSLIAESSEEARLELIKKYTGIVYKIASKYKPFALSIGIDEKDIAQEGLIGLTKAIDTYDVNKNVLFYTYVTICIESNIRSAIKTARKKRNQTLNNSISLDELYENEITNLNEIIKDESADPSIKLIDKENLDEILKYSKTLLTFFEYEVFKLKVDGYSNEEVSVKTKKNKKSIENTLFRIKQKLKEKIKK